MNTLTNFITNHEDKELKNRLVELISESEELKFLVGFFYFSGIKELYQGLKNNSDISLKILVGMNIDNTNLRLLEYADDDQEASDSEIGKKYLCNVRETLSSEDFDTPSFYEQISYFVNMIRDDRLIIRKTRQPNHARIFFFPRSRQQV